MLEVVIILLLDGMTLIVSDDVQQAPIILLKEGTDTSQGKPQLVSNINACQAIVDAVRTTLGPRGMDKLIVDASGYYFESFKISAILRLHTKHICNC